jgi:aminoacyl tRNA synthase complex-interacting multifunctional protein 1
MIDMRVGKVLDGMSATRSLVVCAEADLSVKKHPEADSLYVEQIDIGEAEPRTVCSGLVKYMTEEEIRGATIIVIVRLSCIPSSRDQADPSVT